jgi:predicted unusual protein kinase regulating ubiquinone biosynthesis (AarF/ABC1/UbiB family)
LQDQVPPAALEDIQARIEADFHRPLAEIFQWFASEPMGSASLAQAHQARLRTGETVAVKVLRPRIEAIVEDDLRAVSQVLRRLKCYPRARRFADVDQLIQEFVKVTRNEMDMEMEGRHAEQFAHRFGAHSQVYVPTIYWDYTTPHTLTMEDVAYLKIDDVRAIQAAGIRCDDVARVLFNQYMEQLFVLHVVHADPHAGNLFVKPETGALFQIVYIDFGMVVVIPERLRAGLREYFIGMGLGDARRIVNAYVSMGSIAPDADLLRLEALTQATLDQFRESLLGQYRHIDIKAFHQLLFQQYRDVTLSGTLQCQADLLFASRALAVLSGMLTKIDPNFDPWEAVVPFAQRLQQQAWQAQWQGWIQKMADVIQHLYSSPERSADLVNTFYTPWQNLSPTSRSGPPLQPPLQPLKQAIHRQTRILVAVGLGLIGTIWYVGDRLVMVLTEGEQPGYQLGLWLIVAAIVSLIWAMRKQHF